MYKTMYQRVLRSYEVFFEWILYYTKYYQSTLIFLSNKKSF